MEDHLGPDLFDGSSDGVAVPHRDAAGEDHRVGVMARMLQRAAQIPAGTNG